MRTLVWLALIAVVGACSLDPRVDALGSSDRDNGPLHRAGQPCLVCHSFTVAGTVFQHASDAGGVQGATVEMTDAAGRMFTATTNEVGNFYVTVGSSTRGGREGQAEIAFDPTFPLRVKIQAAGIEHVMRTPIERDGSCAGCHTQVSATSVDHVFARDEGP